MQNTTKGMKNLFEGYLFCKKKDVYVRVDVTNILYLRSDGDYVEGFLTDGQQLFFRGTLSAMEDILPLNEFMRVHRSYIIQIDKITKVNFKEGVIYLDEAQVPMTKESGRTLATSMVRL